MNLITAMAALSLLVPAQEGMTMKPSSQLKKLGYLVGTWKGTGKFYGMGPDPVTVTDTMVIAPTMQGMWLEERHKGYMNKQPFMEGRQFTTYDDQQKKWKAYWFDNAGPYMMEMSGVMSGNAMILTSAALPMPGMNNPVVTRSTMTKHSDRKVDVKVEMQSDGKWSTMIVSTYVKVRK